MKVSIGHNFIVGPWGGGNSFAIQLKQYLENQFKPGMTWQNHTVTGWHIDHIMPCSIFDLSKPEKQKACFHYTNLQPLWYYENIRKSNKV